MIAILILCVLLICLFRLDLDDAAMDDRKKTLGS